MPATRKHLHISKPRRRQRSVSLTTRASRCGVKNYVNVLKSVHPGVEMFFPVTKQYLQEYIDAKKKQGTIKANSLDQYFQHIESYNMALGHGWDSQEFEPMMREVLEDLVQIEEKCGNTRKTTLTANGTEDSSGHEDTNGTASPSITLVCFDVSQQQHPPIKLDREIQIPISNIDIDQGPSVAFQQLCENIANARFPKRWGKADPSIIYFYMPSVKEQQHCPLNVDNFSKFFLEDYQQDRELRLIVYTRQRSVTPAVQTLPMPDAELMATSSKTPLAPLTPRKSPPRLQPMPGPDFSLGPDSSTPSPTFMQQLKSVTIRSPNRVYKQNIAVTDKTTFASLLSFAIKRPPPPGKQFVLQSSDGELEYMPEDPVRKVIHDTLHADVIVKIEDVNEIDFSQF